MVVQDFFVISQDLYQHGLCFIKFNTNLIILFQPLHYVAELFKSYLSFVEIRIIILNLSLNNAGIYSSKAVLLKFIQLFLEYSSPVYPVYLPCLSGIFRI